MKLVKYFLQKKSVTVLLLILVLGGGLFSYIKMGKLEDAPFTIKQALVMTPYPGASPSEVQSQVTDVLEESIQSLGELYYLKTENRAGLSKITVYVKKEIRADEMQQLWDKLRRKVNDVQSKLPAGAGPSVVNDDFGDVLGVFYGLTGEGYSYRELENQAKLIKNVLLRVKDVAKVEIYGVQSPTIDVILNPSVMARSGITTTDISRAFDAQNRVVDAGGIDAGVNRIRIESTGNFYSLDDIRNMTIVSRTGEHLDILFLDIQLTDGNSFLFIEQAHPESMIVFTTAYDEYAVRAFSVNSIDYLLKPIHEDRLMQTIQRFEGLTKNYIHDFNQESRMLEILQQLSAAQETSVSVQKKYRTRFLISSGEKLFTLQVSDIAYFYSENKLTFAVTHKNHEYLIDLALDRLSEQLDPDHFFRTNRQTLVCIDAIQRIESYFLGKAIVHVQPPFKDKIMISKDKMASFRMWLNY